MIRIHSCYSEDITIVSNAFLDRFLPEANGDYLRVYFYLLRAAGTDGGAQSIDSIADSLNLTERDVVRALSYWEKEQALSLACNEDHEITEIAFTYLARQTAGKKTAGETGPQAQSAGLPEGGAGKAEVPVTKKEEKRPSDITADRMKELGEREEVRELFFIAMQYLDRQLSRSEMQKICYFYDELGFSPDLIDYLMEYCVSRGHKNFRYIEKVAYAWKEEGIHSVHEARVHAGSYHKEYYDILKALGVNNHHPVEAEIKIMKKWIETWKFPMELIEEACARTVMNATKPTLNYADSILSRWHSHGVKSMEDVKVLDDEHARRAQKETQKPDATVSKSAREAAREFEQRTYDYDAITRRLLKS